MSDNDEQLIWQAVSQSLRGGVLGGIAERPHSVHETHGSIVAVIGALAVKLKKPVRVDAFDYSSRERRKAVCEREIEVNRPLGGDIYQGVRGVRAVPEGYELCAANEPDCVEHVVVMRRVEPSRRLDQRIMRGDLLHDEMRTVARHLGAFHATAPPASPPAGTPETVTAWAHRRLAVINTASPEVLEPGRVEAASGFVRAWIAANHQRLQQRAADGCIRLGHGDLRLEHVVLGPFAVLDAIDFDDAYRAQDVLADLSFLAMELQAAGREDLTRLLLEGWAAEAGHVEEQLLWAYATMKALVRVEVELDRIAQLPAGLSRQIAEERASALLNVAIQLSWRARPPHPVIFAGLPGTGKTTISEQLAKRWGLERASSDDIRKRFIGLGPNDEAPAAAYDDHVSQAVYQSLGREAGREVAVGRSFVVDATFRRTTDAQAFIHAYHGAGGRSVPVAIECITDPERLRERVHHRSTLGGAHARIDVLERQLSAQPPFGLAISNSIPLPTDAPLERTLAASERIVLDATVG